MNSRESKKFEKLTERFKTLSDDELLCEYEKTALWSAQQYREMIERGKAKSLGLEMSAISREFMRRGIVDRLEVFLNNENLEVQAHAAYLLLFQGRCVSLPEILNFLQKICDLHKNSYASTITISALNRYEHEQFMKEHT
jgi:hypothetical protein